MMRKLLRVSPKLAPDVKVLFPHQRMHVSFADEPCKEVEMRMLVNFAQELYKLFKEIDMEEEVHLRFGFANWIATVCIFDYEDAEIYHLFCRDAKNGYR